MYPNPQAWTSSDAPTQFGRIILHADMNCFYAAVECFRHPEIRDKPVVVGGDEKARHGIVLAKNMVAKRAGVRTAMTLREARAQCPGLVILPPDYRLYLRYSREARAIYYDYSSQVEPFGPDEAWLDVTASAALFGGPEHAGLFIAREISERVKAELGVTVSIGVSWNKIFAKFGSDYKKPDGITAITPDNYRTLVWEAPVEELLYVGPATKVKLRAAGILTIGDLAQHPLRGLRERLGKMGEVLQTFAQGRDITAVRELNPEDSSVSYAVKSIGNGLTSPHDLVSATDAKVLTYLLAESVAQRLREHRLKARTIAVYVRGSDLSGYSRQRALLVPSYLTVELADAAFALIAQNEPFDGKRRLRSLTVQACDLISECAQTQTTFLTPEDRRIALEHLEHAVDDLRSRYGNRILMRGVELRDGRLAGKDIKGDNIVHPVSYFM